MANLADLAREQPGQHQRCIGRGMARQRGRQRNERLGENIGQHNIETASADAVQRRCLDAFAHAVALCVFAGGAYRLIVDIHGRNRRRAQTGGGHGENPRAAAVIEHMATGDVRLREPFQAQGRGRVGARTEGQPRVETHHDGIVIDIHRRFVRGDPQPPAEAQRRVLGQPGTRPVLVGQAADTDRHVLTQRFAQRLFDGRRARTLGEQARHPRGVEAGVLVRRVLDGDVVTRVEHRDGLGVEALEHGLGERGAVGFHGDLQPRHRRGDVIIHGCFLP